LCYNQKIMEKDTSEKNSRESAKNPKEVEHRKDHSMRYKKQFQLVETDVELPIQGQVLDPEDLYIFLRDLQDENLSKVIGIFLDDNNLFLGHQVFLGQSAETFKTGDLYWYYILLQAKKFIALTNHLSGDPTPNEHDIKLIQRFKMDERTISFEPAFADYVIVGDKSYYSMSTNDGTDCHCGHQKYVSEN